jgi:hypothetical protein
VRHLTRGNKGLAPPSFLEPGPDRISPPTRASTVYHGPGFETASPEASACLYAKSSRLSWEFIAPRYRRGCPSVALQSRGLHYTAAGFAIWAVKLVTPTDLDEHQSQSVRLHPPHPASDQLPPQGI